jgi:signal transduction histidine kinase
MSIRNRIFLIVAVTILSVFGSFLFLLQFVLLPEFVAIEQAEMNDYLLQIETEFEEQDEEIFTALLGYAYWDDTYFFLRDGNPNYITANFTEEYIDATDLDFLAMADATGTVQASLLLLAEDAPLMREEDILQVIQPLMNMALYPDTDSFEAGIVDVRGQLFMVGALPALRNDQSGPATGVVVGGRLIDDKAIEELTDSELVNLSVFALSTALPPDVSNVIARLTDDDDMLIEPLSDEMMAAFVYVDSPFGEHTMLIEILVERTRLQNAYRTTNTFIGLLFGMGTLLTLIALRVLNKTIVDPLRKLQDWMDDRSTITTTDERVSISGYAEIEALGKAFNRLLDRIGQAQNDTERARDQALEALAFKEQLLQNVSHDARTPLSVIMLRTENMMRGMYGAVTLRQQEVLDGVRASANQMLFFINNLLAGAKLQAGRLTVRHDHVSVSGFVNEIKTMMEPLAHDQGLKLSVRIDTALPSMVTGDSERLKQIVFNLVDNAIKFTPEGGAIDLELRLEDAAHWSIHVDDTGRGIPKDSLAHIFEAFYQVDGSSTRTAAGGVGLGLSIVRQLVDLMGGRIDVQSEVGAGTRFTIRLPLLVGDTNMLERMG